MSNNKQNTVKKAKDIINKVSDTGRVIGKTVQKGAMNVYDKAKEGTQKMKIKKLSPVSLELYKSSEFNIPNVIKIVDDAERRGNALCEGAIGWRSTIEGIEIFNLYDEAIKESEIHFIPAPICNAVYCVDNFDRSRFIKVENVFEQAHSEKIAELEHIAYYLGAKRCVIRIEEANTEENYDYSKREAKETVRYKSVTVSAEETLEQSLSNRSTSSRAGETVAEFEGNDTPRVPNLKWFQYDANIKGLIEMRCSNSNSIKSKTLKLSGTASATMSEATAGAIDSAVNKMGNKLSTALKKQAAKENRSSLFFTVEF